MITPLNQMELKIKKKYFIISIIVVSGILYLFWGPLFPWNPIKIGFNTISSPKATIYINALSERDSVVYHIDKILEEAEEFHGLKYKDDFKIIILNEDNNMKRYLPWLKGLGYSVSLSLVNVIYIGPIARKAQSGIEWHLKHEISHLLVGQNTTFKKALKMHEQGWFVEGIAEYFSGHNFYDKDEFLQLCKINNLKPSGLYEKNPHKMSASELKLKYSYYGFFIGFLVERYGIEKLQEYLKIYIMNPENYKNLFIKVYMNNLDEILELFNSKLNE